VATDKEAVSVWVQSLGLLTGPGQTREEADQNAKMYATLLAMEFDDGCFGTASLAYVARRSSYFPGFSQLCDLLAAWARDEYRPGDKPALTGPADLWRAKVDAERAEAQRDWSDPAAVLKSIHILDDHPRRGHLGPLLGALVLHHAPQHVRLLPPEFLSEEARTQAEEMRAASAGVPLSSAPK